MSPDRDERNDDLEPDTYEEEPPRSIFAATWFRAVLILIVLGVVGAVAVPYILDAVNPPSTQQALVKSAPLPAQPSPSAPPPAPTPARPPAGPTTGQPVDSASSPVSRALPAPTAPRVTPPPVPMPDAAKPAAPTAKPPGPVAKADVPAATPADQSAKPEVPTATPKPEAPVKNGAASKTTPGTSAPTSTKPAAKKPSEPRKTAAAKTATPAATGVYWVQVGAFKDEETAKRLVVKLREQGFKVADVSTSTPAPAASAASPAPTASPSAPAAPAGADQYDVFVTGLPPAELSSRLTAKGLAAETSGNGVVIRPSLPLRDAVALSKDLAVDGLKVQVRRAGGAAARPPARPQPTTTATANKVPAGGDGLYRVRVGSFADRAAAAAAQRELEAKGYTPFIARGER
jgi:cell division septation protein DedD